MARTIIAIGLLILVGCAPNYSSKAKFGHWRLRIFNLSISIKPYRGINLL
ncbi:MAG: hypothetical protein HYU68_07535 [Bacteroidetes bacterium]|nr:hypothetical protein [Bacteroidota bacterium]